jgi:hypothetical protein
MNTLLIRPIAHVDEMAQVDPGWTDSDIAAIVEEFLRAQLDPGSCYRQPQIDPGLRTNAQLDPGMKAQLDPGTVEPEAQVDPGFVTRTQVDPGFETRTQVDPGYVDAKAQIDPGF